MTSNGTEEIVDKSEEAEASRKEDGKEESVRQQPKSHLDVVPQILWLLSQSPKHKYLFVGDLEWYLLAPLQLRQFRLFNKDKTPIGFASWAYVSDEVEERLSAGASRLKPDDWKSGEQLWLVDLCAPFGGGGDILKELRENVFKGQNIKTVQPTPDGSGTAVVER